MKTRPANTWLEPTAAPLLRGGPGKYGEIWGLGSEEFERSAGSDQVEWLMHLKIPAKNGRILDLNPLFGPENEAIRIRVLSWRGCIGILSGWADLAFDSSLSSSTVFAEICSGPSGLGGLAGRDVIPNSMQLVAGRSGQAYNQRKQRKGAYWADPYHATAVETGEHLRQCLGYIDLNMVAPVG